MAARAWLADVDLPAEANGSWWCRGRSAGVTPSALLSAVAGLARTTRALALHQAAALFDFNMFARGRPGLLPVGSRAEPGAGGDAVGRGRPRGWRSVDLVREHARRVSSPVSAARRRPGIRRPVAGGRPRWTQFGARWSVLAIASR